MANIMRRGSIAKTTNDMVHIVKIQRMIPPKELSTCAARPEASLTAFTYLS